MSAEDDKPLSKRALIGCGLALVLVPLSLGIAVAGIALALIALNGLGSLSGPAKMWLFWLWPSAIALVPITALGAYVLGAERKQIVISAVVFTLLAVTVFAAAVPFAMWTR